MAPFEILGRVGAVAVLRDLGDDRRAGGLRMREVSVEVVDVCPWRVRNGRVVNQLSIEAKEENGDVAVMELDPGGIFALGWDARPRAELEHARQPPRRARRILVVQRDAQTCEFPGATAGGFARVAPGDQPA